MENLGVISRVNEPTPWCAAMVTVPKASGAVRICVDMKLLNENVLQEIYPMPKVDTTLAQLTGAVMFSKLDANSGFWQIPLAKPSRLLTTFIIPYGPSSVVVVPLSKELYSNCSPEPHQTW